MKHFQNRLPLNLKEEREKNIGKATGKSPRSDQQETHAAMTKFFDGNGKRGILTLPTGAGKTYTAVYWLLKNIIPKNKKILWLADQGFLLEQAYEEFRQNILEVEGTRRETINLHIVSGNPGHGKPNSISINDDILLITAQTAISNWEDKSGGEPPFRTFINHHGKEDNLFIVYDEAHHTPAFGRRNLLIGGSEGRTGILEKFPNTNLLGLTATPTYTNEKQRGWLWKIFTGGVFFEKTKQEMELAGILAHPHYIQRQTNFDAVLSDDDVEKLTLKHQDIPAHIIEELAKSEQRNSFIAEHLYNNLDHYGKTIIFTDRWYQCRHIENYINKKAGKTIAASVFSYVDGNKGIDYINNRTHDQNDLNLKAFKKDEIKILLNVRMLTEGVDVPNVKTVFLTRDTNSTILFTQMVGRALRGKKAGGNKDTANIVLFTDNWNRHVLFAYARSKGGSEDETLKERGYRWQELMRIDLIDKLRFEYERQEYNTPVLDLIPVGWFVVKYNDSVADELNENEENAPAVETINENVLVMEKELAVFKTFIEEFKTKHMAEVWERETLDLEIATEKASAFFEENGMEPNKVLCLKLIKIARHMGQNLCEKPRYYTFEQREQADVRRFVDTVWKEQWGPEARNNFLQHEYHSSENPFLAVLYPTFQNFKDAYRYEEGVYEKLKMGSANISTANQDVKHFRLASPAVRKIVFERDEYECVCCGSRRKLEPDHIISYQIEQAMDDHPNLYQTLCKTCNIEKSSKLHNYRITAFAPEKFKLEPVLNWDLKDPTFYFTRLVNCYYKTSAVIKSSVEAKNHGKSIWKMRVRHGANPDQNILKEKEALMKIITDSGFRLKDLIIEG